METFNAIEAARLAGFSSTTMLNYLERSETFKSQYAGVKHHGKARRYSYRDVVILRAINRLLELGARPKRIQQALRTFSTLENLPNDADELMAFAHASSFFVVTQSSVTYCRSANELVELTTAGQMTFSFMMDNESSFAAVATTILKYSRAVKSNRPRNISTLNRCAKECGLDVSSYAN